MTAEDWIKVTDKMPKIGVDLLVYDEQQGVLVAEYDGAWGFDNYEHGMLDFVTHWMPLVLPNEEEV